MTETIPRCRPDFWAGPGPDRVQLGVVQIRIPKPRKAECRQVPKPKKSHKAIRTTYDEVYCEAYQTYLVLESRVYHAAAVQKALLFSVDTFVYCRLEL